MIKNSRILITGVAGFIGSHIAERLCEDNTVIGIDDLSSGDEYNLDHIKNKITFKYGDIRDSLLVKELTRKVDYIFHLAANVGNIKSLENPFLDMSVNIEGTINLLEACRGSKVKKIVYSSSSAIYGDKGKKHIEEWLPKVPESQYAVSKYSAEKYMVAYNKIYNIPFIALRYFNVYGTRQGSSEYANAIPVFFRNMKEGKVTIFGDGEQTRDFVNAEDVVDANIQAAESKINHGVFNIATGKSITINKLVDIIKKITGANPIIEYKDRRAGEVVHSCANIADAAFFLHYKPKISIELGLQKYYEYYTDKS